MKRFITIVFFLHLILLFSCDPSSYYSYYVLNNCDTVVRIRMIADLGDPKAKHGSFGYADSVVVLNPGMQSLIYHFHSFNTVELNIDVLKPENVFRTLSVTKGKETSKVNYLNDLLWKKEQTGEYHMNLYLVILPSDFYEDSEHFMEGGKK